MKYRSVLERAGGLRGVPAIVASSAVALLIALVAPAGAGAQAFDPALEGKNFAKIEERLTYLTGTPEFQTKLQEQNARDLLEFPLLLANDPERNPLGNICAQRKNECAGDVRFYDWGDSGYGIQTPVLFTGRSGATISGTVWGTLAGPEPKPGIVITTGSVQAPETLYWGLAASLAKAGYVVLTYDVQGQGRSDTFGVGTDQNEGVPSQAGQPFYDGTEDALDFLLSTSASPYVPRDSCGTGTSHADKQSNRVAAGLNAAFNPLGTLVDPTRVGIAGHSLGAGAVSFIGQRDPRVDAIVAWDNLGTGVSGGPACASNPTSRGLKPLTAATAGTFKPALGMSADYGLTQNPYASNPNPESKNSAFNQFAGTTPATAGVQVDSMQVNIRGGTHYEFSLIPGNTAPNPLGAATLRGMDMVSWYTVAWFDKYVKCPGAADPAACGAEADSDLLTDRWRDDARTEEIDLNADPNMFSFYLRSEYDFGLTGGGRAICMTDDDPLIPDGSMRPGCAEMGPDGDPLPYDYHDFARTPDEAPPPGDTDMDGVPDLQDSCPTIPGPPSNAGCPVPPDSDGDTVPDAADACPAVAGSPNNDGCPTPGDGDSDGVPDAADACPTTPGSPDNEGCPLPGDRDGDGVSDAADACPDERGPVQNEGCPRPGDRDADGIPNAADSCPDTFGPAENDGCPPPGDRDGDGVSDAADACPDDYGTNQGCPPFGDRDHDGVVNAQDACVDTPGPASNQGCPVPSINPPSAPTPGPSGSLPCALTATRGTRGPDKLTGTSASDHISGLSGADTIAGLGGDDCLSGQRGRDRLDGGEGSDVLRASAGSDLVIAGPGADTVLGGLGNDRIDSRDGERDYVACGRGNDRVRADAADNLRGCEHVTRG